MTVGVWVLGDQLWAGQAALRQCAENKARTPTIAIESSSFARERPYHRQKLVLVWSAMRHFAEELRADGWPVTYKIADNFESALKSWIDSKGITELLVMIPSDRPFTRFLKSLDLPCTLTLVPNNHFLWTEAEFSQWAKGRKSLLLETFYRQSRKRFGVLMNGDEPEGGQWNFDKSNRKPPKGKLNPPDPLLFEPDDITQEVMARVESDDISTYGDIELFGWAVTRQQALQVLDNFIECRLATFGPYQDAMVTGQDTMWHSLLSPYLNLGLLQPMEVIRAAEAAYRNRQLPLNSVEGLIRQVLGWREYVRGLYVHVDEDYGDRNWFDHTLPLPEFFWTAETKMNCLKQVLSQVKRTGYAHHIQRLMVLSNFALIAGLSPQEVESWFHAAFIDGYDWVMQTNVLGMGLFADGGVLASKPYAASANYIHKMSDYCSNCTYDRKQKIGDNACPFNTLYWDFLDRHRDKLKANGRMNLVLANLNKLSTTDLQEIRDRASICQAELS
ncbi:MAG: cryptochrome/photolyase family protein [Cyanobacteria bacterium P01_E01_bin.34]